MLKFQGAEGDQLEKERRNEGERGAIRELDV